MRYRVQYSTVPGFITVLYDCMCYLRCMHSRDTSLQTVHYSTKYYVQLSTDHFERKKKGSEDSRRV